MAEATAAAPLRDLFGGTQKPAPEGALHQLKSLLRAAGSAPQRRWLALLALGIVAAIGANMVGQVRLNVWLGDFYDALEQRQLTSFLNQILVFLAIVAGLLTMVVAETWLREMLEVRTREWLTHDLLDQWLVSRRAYLLAFAGEIGVNPDQRLQADALRLSELTVGLSIGLLRSSLLLLSFLGVLWYLSSEVVLVAGERSFTIPGYLVWCALAYAISGSWLTWRVGKPLIAINAERYAREADLRFALVRINELAEGIALHRGEPDERRALNRPVDQVVLITRRLANALARLTWITSGYGWLALIVPILVAAPGYFNGTLSFGELMMAVGAFNQVQQSLRWFVDNFPQIADWRATLFRVVALRDALPVAEELGKDVEHIAFVESASGHIRFDELSVALVDGWARLDDPHVEVAPRERLLIAGGSSSGKSTMFRAMAGLWPWGTGTIHLPSRADLMFLPQRPYLPLGTLCAAVCYPDAPETFEETAVGAVLERVGLSHLAPALDQEERWDKRLSLEEQQRLVLARLLLHKPRAVFLDDVMSALGGEQRALAVSIFERELAGTTVISIGDAPVEDDFYHRVVQIVRSPAAVDLRTPSHPDSFPALKPPPRPESGASVIPGSLAPMQRRVDPSHPPQLKRR